MDYAIATFHFLQMHILHKRPFNKLFYSLPCARSKKTRDLDKSRHRLWSSVQGFLYSDPYQAPILKEKEKDKKMEKEQMQNTQNKMQDVYRIF